MLSWKVPSTYLLYSWPYHSAPSVFSLPISAISSSETRTVGLLLTSTWAEKSSLIIRFTMTGRGATEGRGWGSHQLVKLGTSWVRLWARPSGQVDIFFTHIVWKKHYLYLQQRSKIHGHELCTFPKSKQYKHTDVPIPTHQRKHIHVLRPSPAPQLLWNLTEKNYLSIPSHTFDNIHSAKIKFKQKVLKEAFKRMIKLPLFTYLLFFLLLWEGGYFESPDWTRPWAQVETATSWAQLLRRRGGGCDVIAAGRRRRCLRRDSACCNAGCLPLRRRESQPAAAFR